MGGDGQALGNKHSLLNKSKQYTCEENCENIEKVSETEKRKDRWRMCGISLEPLESPVVFDLGGELYSKRSVLDYLLRKKRLEDDEKVIEIKKLSEVREVANKMISDSFMCPITEYLTSSGVHSFVGFWGCGHVVANAALSNRKKVSRSSKEPLAEECPICGLCSVKVSLVLPSEEEKEQRSRLRQYLRSVRKRGREGS